MRKVVYVCDHCGAQFNSVNGYPDVAMDDLDFIKNVDLCVDCYEELCDIVREFIGEDTSQ